MGSEVRPTRANPSVRDSRRSRALGHGAPSRATGRGQQVAFIPRQGCIALSHILVPQSSDTTSRLQRRPLVRLRRWHTSRQG